MYLRGKKLSSLPDNFGNLEFLAHLDLSLNNIRTLPESFGNLKSLKSLDLGNNPLTSLPDNFGNLESLENLSIYFSKLTYLPESFGNLKSLKFLDILDDNLIYLPESFGNLKSLKKLDLCIDTLTSLPDNFGNLESLENLSIEGGNLTCFPESFCKLSNLKSIHIENVPLKSLSNIPEHLFQWDRMTIDADLTPRGTYLLSKSRREDLHEYYRKTPDQLAKEYISDPKSLTEDEIERLIHEAGKKEEELIENEFPIGNFVLRKIIERDSHRLSNGSKILI